ncbi:hypothetical protein EYF80_064378 [Liparis tanakae]|uniref:Uncharacterized protein n=1 Tax=Liparis tanakae TaxID=230148 RepID=A0A4Z2EB51_9TELE|nr:hypothetical protein EYF80_064378 [Liparis tanakae]
MRSPRTQTPTELLPPAPVLRHRADGTLNKNETAAKKSGSPTQREEEEDFCSDFKSTKNTAPVKEVLQHRDTGPLCPVFKEPRGNEQDADHILL